MMTTAHSAPQRTCSTRANARAHIGVIGKMRCHALCAVVGVPVQPDVRPSLCRATARNLLSTFRPEPRPAAVGPPGIALVHGLFFECTGRATCAGHPVNSAKPRSAAFCAARERRTHDICYA